MNMPNRTINTTAFSLLSLVLMGLFSMALAPRTAFAQSATDNFNRANGPLGPNWTDIADGGLAISSDAVVGTSTGVSGDIRTGEAYSSDQYSQVQVTSTQLTGVQWIGPAVRLQNSGLSGYLGIYYWNNGNPELMLFLRSGGGWTPLGNAYNCGALAAGTQLEMTATGSTISFLENGVARITVTDTSLTGGAPGIVSAGTGSVGNWSGGDITIGSSYSIGGAVTGLSGTVVLQDNNSDTLSVSNNGSFTFAALLITGNAYNVTVETNPTGQTCAVTNGSGTVASANIANVAIACTSVSDSGGIVTDNFNRANGPLGPNWTNITDGGLAISSDAVVGTSTGVSGDIRTGEAYSSNHYSQVQVTSTQLTGVQWIGPAVRLQNSGLSGYVGIYYWNNGNPELMLYKRSGESSWTQLGRAYSCGALAAGTQLELAAAGSTISFLENGVARITVTDTSFTGGAPGIISAGTGSVGNWSGGDIDIASSYSIGGAVTGLSGTVVLQDNNGDTLSVSNNGSFTFATLLIAGNIYNVTVESNPQEQTCAVTNGSGAVLSANVTSVAITCATITYSEGTITDNFNRPNGPLGPNWTDIIDGGLAISSGVVVGTSTGVSGDIRTGEFYRSDHYSQVQVTSTQLTGYQWIGPAVRLQDAGQNGYVGIYYWNNGNPELMIFLKSGGGSWTQLGNAYSCGALAAGTQLELSATGSTISFLENGVARITVTDTSLTGGAPGIVSAGTGSVANWSGGDIDIASAYSIGGAVTGLSGTVVLQDINGDTLSVSNNGSFTFAALLITGNAYNVTVETNPIGQACAVTNGSGTVASANVTSVAIACTSVSGSGGTATDNFNRANGPLGPNWTNITDGGLAISSDAVVGTTTGVSGDIRTAEAYSSNQYSQVQVTSTQLTGVQWIGPAVRLQNSGQNGYAGSYYWNNGNPELMIFKRSGGGSWTQLGNTYNCGPLTVGTQLKLMAVGNTLAFLENGVERIAVFDASFSGGAPGIIANGTGTVGNWSGGTAGFEAHYLSTDLNGVESYHVISANNGYGPQVLRILRPTHPATGVAHNVVFALPVEAGLGTDFGDGLQTLQQLDAQDQYNLTIVAPSFNFDPWYADSATDPNIQYETFMATELEPWVAQNLSTTGAEQNWLIGFSKSGIGGQDLILKHPNLFTLAASWDFPADMSSYNQFGADSAAAYGTDANFQSNYRLTSAFMDAHKAPFLAENRIWIGGYGLYQTDDSDYASLLAAKGIADTTETPTLMDHDWYSGWVPLALTALEQDSINLNN
jgi:predicted acyltransferase (DUF342 family)